MFVQVEVPPVAQLLIPWHSLISAKPKQSKEEGLNQELQMVIRKKKRRKKKRWRKETEKKLTRAGHPVASVTSTTGTSEGPRSVGASRRPRRAVGGSCGALVDI